MADALQLKVVLRGVKPLVWRRVVIPGSMKLSVVNAVVLVAMGWSGYHLYEFEAAGRRYAEPNEEWEDDALDANEYRLTDIAIVGGWFLHKYDFGDGWVHRIEVEAVTNLEGVVKASCLAGRNACPPEDVGGPQGYADFLKAIRDPKHDDHEWLVEWAGGAFDPAAFDLAETQALVARVKRPIETF